jgi:hypothetical protein
VCVIDNSSVIVAGGSAAEALIAPEMVAFGRALGFAFRPHRRSPNPSIDVEFKKLRAAQNRA